MERELEKEKWTSKREKLIRGKGSRQTYQQADPDKRPMHTHTEREREREREGLTYAGIVKSQVAGDLLTVLLTNVLVPTNLCRKNFFLYFNRRKWSFFLDICWKSGYVFCPLHFLSLLLWSACAPPLLCVFFSSHENMRWRSLFFFGNVCRVCVCVCVDFLNVCCFILTALLIKEIQNSGPAQYSRKAVWGLDWWQYFSLCWNISSGLLFI